MANEKETQRVRRKYAAEWAALNPTLARGEMVYEMDSHMLKVGDGVLDYSSLPYIGVPDLDGILDTNDVASVLNKRYVTDADLVKLANTSGVNTGDQTNITGNAGTATALQTTRFFNGQAFNGTADVTIPIVSDANALTGTTLAVNVVNSSLTSVGTLAALTVTAPITGSVTGNSATATALQTARTIDGTSFDGSANITVVAPAIDAAASKATPVDADKLALADSAAAFVLKHLTWANLKATLKNYFDTLYHPLYTVYTSPDQVITSAGLLTLSHGLPSTPTIFDAALVNQIAEANYSIGDVVACDNAPDNAVASRGISITADGTNIYVRYGAAAGVFAIMNKTTGAVVASTNVKWKLRLKAKVDL